MAFGGDDTPPGMLKGDDETKKVQRFNSLQRRESSSRSNISPVSVEINRRYMNRIGETSSYLWAHPSQPRDTREGTHQDPLADRPGLTSVMIKLPQCFGTTCLPANGISCNGCKTLIPQPFSHVRGSLHTRMLRTWIVSIRCLLLHSHGFPFLRHSDPDKQNITTLEGDIAFFCYFQDVGELDFMG